MKACSICWTRWGRELWENSCICTGAVSKAFTLPGTLSFNPEIKDLSKDGKRIMPKATKKLATPQPQEFVLF